MKKWFLLVVGAILFGCTLQKDFNSPSSTASSGVSVVEKFEAPMSYEDLKQGAYIGGAIVYDETNPEISHVRGGLIYQVRLDKRDVYAETLSFEYVQYGFVRIKSISSSEVVLDVLLYNEKGEEIVNQVNVVLAKGKEIDINGDGVADIGYESAVKDGNKRAGYENANHLKFLSSKEKATRTMFMPMLNQTLGKAKHVACINSSGTMVVNFESTNVIKDGDEWIVELDAKEYPLLKAGDYLVNKVGAVVYKVVAVSQGEKYLYRLERSEKGGAFDVISLSFQGELGEVMARFDPESYNRYRGSIRLYNFNYDARVIDEANLKLGIKMNGYADLIVDCKADAGLDWKKGGWASAYLEVKIASDNNFGLYGWYNAKYTKGAEVYLGGTSFRFVIGVVPFEVAAQFWAGVTLTTEASGSLEGGVRLSGESGFRAEGSIWTGTPWSSGGVRFSPRSINTMKVEVIPPSVKVSGKASLKPYLKVSLGVRAAEVVGGGIDGVPYVEGEVIGDAAYTTNGMWGSLDFNVYAGITANGFFDIGVQWLNIYKKWDLGRFLDYRQKLYTWHWDASMLQPTSLDIPTGLQTVKDEDNGVVTLSWNVVNMSSGYKVERWRDGVLDGTWVVTARSFRDSSGLVANRDYVYRVYAKNGPVESAPAISSTVRFSLPPIPTGLTITPKKTGSFVITWNPVSGAKSYKVYRRVDGVSNRVYTVTTNRLEDTDLTTNVSYSYAVSAVKWCGEGDVSSYQNAGTAPDPDQVTGINHIWRANTAITLRWNAADGAVKYRVRRTWSGGSVEFLTGDTEIEDASLLPDTEYTYTVTAQNYIKYGPVSASYVVRTPGKDDPQVVVLNLTNGQKLRNTYTIQGLAFLSNSSIRTVYVVHSAPSFVFTNVIQMYSGVTNWSLPVTLRVGETNTFEIWCEDYSGRQSIKLVRFVESLFVLKGIVSTLPAGPVEMTTSSSGLFYVASTNALRVYDIYGNLKYSLAMPLLFKIGFSDVNSRLYILSNVITIQYLSNGIWGTNVSSNTYSIGMYRTNLQWIGEYVQFSSASLYTYGTYRGVWANSETLGMKVYDTNIFLLGRGLFSEVVYTGGGYYTNPPVAAYGMFWREVGTWFGVMLTNVSSLHSFWVTNTSSIPGWPWFILQNAYTTTVPHYDTVFQVSYWGNVYANYTNFRTFSSPDLPISVDGNEQYVVLMFTNRVEVRDYNNQLLQVISNTFSDTDGAMVPKLILDKGYLLIRKGNILWIYK